MINSYFAQTYGSCAYGSGTDQTGSCGNGTAAAASSSGGNLLTNTGFDIAVIVTIACSIIFIGLMVRFWKRSAKSSSSTK